MPPKTETSGMPPDFPCELAVPAVVRHEKERFDGFAFAMLYSPHHRVDERHERRVALAVPVLNPVLTEKVIALDRLVPDRFILLAPNAPPVPGAIRFYDSFRPIRPVRNEPRHIDALAPGIYVVIAGNKEFLDDMTIRCPILREDAIPGIRMKLEFLHKPAISHIAAMHDGINVLAAEIFKRGDKEPVGLKTLPPSGIRSEMSVAQDTKHKIRFFRMFPAFRRGEDPPAGKRGKSQRGDRALQKVTTGKTHSRPLNAAA